MAAKTEAEAAQQRTICVKVMQVGKVVPEVCLPEGSKVVDALRAVGIDPNKVKTAMVKVNNRPQSLDYPLEHTDKISIVGKISGGI